MGSKYLFVINSFLAGGAEWSLIELLPRLQEQGVVPIVVCLREREVGFESQARALGVDLRNVPGANLVAKAVALRRLIRQEHPDLVYTALFDADLVGRLAAIGLSVPVVTNLANTAYDPARWADPNVDRKRLRLVRWIDGITARHLTDHFHAVSQAVKDSTATELRVPPDRITVIKRGRDPVRLGERTPERRQLARQGLGVGEDAEVIVAVGRQEYQKGHRYLVEAMAEVVAHRSRARLLVAGREGHASAELNAQIKQLGLGQVVSLLGHREDVAEVMAAADLFVFPSLYEGLGGALIEAMALSLPVVASDIAAVKEVVRDAENADLVPPGDPSALADTIVALLQDPGRQERYGARSRELFEAEFRADDANRRMVEFLARMAQVGKKPIR